MKNIVIMWQMVYFLCPKDRQKNMMKLTTIWSLKPEDLVDGKQSFNRYRMVIFFVSKFLTEIANIDEMYKMLN